jgi:predicted nucleic acid-binding protein
MPDRVFVDTNILIYAHDLDAGTKHEISRRIVVELWEKRSGALSTQVLQEFYINITKKIAAPLAPATARNIISTYFSWRVEEIHPDSILQASEISEKHNLSFWDALIVVAARAANAAAILTEDLNAGQVIEGIVVNNPFTP